jgi:coenzyme F420-reducing hydrogenase beta subunit
MGKKIKKHINNASEMRKCTSCQMCYSVCPTDAISIKFNKNGFYRPFVDENACIGCQKCINVCYKLSDDLNRFDLEELAKVRHYSAVTKNRKLLQETSSGGIAHEISELLCSKGYKVVGVTYNANNDIVEHKVAQFEEDLQLFKGSKYIHANNQKAFDEIVANAKEKGFRYAFFGLPCEIYALAKFAEINHVRDQFLLIDLYCHGVPSYLLWSKYITELKEKQPLISYDSVNFRSKKLSSWGEYRIEFFDQQNGSSYFGKKNDPFFELFFSNQLLNESCNDCILRGNISYCDIRLGDFWGPKFVFNSDGYSLITVNSEHGERVISELKKKISMDLCEIRDFAPYQQLFSSYTVDQTLRNRLINKLKDQSQNLDAIVDDYYSHIGFSKKVKRSLKKVLMLFPYRLTQFLKYIYYNIK